MPVSKNTRKGKPRPKSQSVKSKPVKDDHTLQDSVKQLNLLQGQCLSAIGYAAKLGQLADSPQVNAYVQKDKLTQAYILLSKDLTQMSDKISALAPKHRTINEISQSDNSDSPDHLFTILDLCGAYQEWIEEFESAVRPTINDIELHLIQSESQSTSSESV